MGCALRKPAGTVDSRRHKTSTAGGGNNAVKIQEKQETLHVGEHSGVILAPERRRRRLDSFVTSHQGWPPWLMVVAGDALGDWTPRRANTFEKLAKVSVLKFELRSLIPLPKTKDKNFS